MFRVRVEYKCICKKVIAFLLSNCKYGEFVRLLSVI